MTDKTNHLRVLLQAGKPSLATRIWSTWPIVIEAAGSTGNYDYVEFVGEYTPFSQSDLENMARAAELHGMSLMMKVDFQNRGYVAQKAIASGVQAILFTDCRNAQEVEESIHLVTPETAQDGGQFGYPNRRFIGFQPYLPQMEHAQRQRDIVRAFMIEKKSAVDDIEAICSVPGVDMIQFRPVGLCDELWYESQWLTAARCWRLRKKLSQRRWRMGSPYAVRSQRRRRLSRISRWACDISLWATR